MEEDIQSDAHNPVNEEQDVPIQEYQEEIEIKGVNEISDTDSTTSNVIISDRESQSLEILEHTIKGQVYMQASKVKRIDRQTKK